MRKLFSGLFAVVGTILMAGTALLCLISLNATPKILEFPQEASRTVQSFASALSQGDWNAVGSCIYGQPDLTADAAWDDDTKNTIWQAYVQSFSCTPAREPEATDQGIDWTVQFTMLDMAALMDSWQQQTNTLLSQQEEQTDALAQQALTQGLSQALSAQPATTSRELTLHLIYRDDQWWISPDTTLLQTLSGQA